MIDQKDRAVAWAWRWGIILLLALAVQRTTTVIGLHTLTQGRAFTDDQSFIIAFIQYPMQILMGRDQGGPSFWPPLFPLVIMPLGRLFLAAFDHFLTARFLSVSFEIVAWPFVWMLILYNFPTTMGRLLAGATYVMLPVAIGTTAGMAQDESVSLCGMAILCVLVLKGRILTACVCCALLATAAKIYFLVPLAALVLAPPSHRYRDYVLRGIVSAVPILAIYGVAFYNQVHSDELAGIGLAGFTSVGQHGVSLWPLLGSLTTSMSPESIKHTSGLLAFAGAMIPLVTCKLLRLQVTGYRLIALMGGMLLSVLLLFAHCDPEYYLMAMPPLFAILSLRPLLAFAFAALSSTFLANIAYGVLSAKRSGLTQTGKAVFVDLFDRWSPLPAEVLHPVFLGIVVTTNAVLVFLLYRKLFARNENASADVQLSRTTTPTS